MSKNPRHPDPLAGLVSATDAPADHPLRLQLAQTTAQVRALTAQLSVQATALAVLLHRHGGHVCVTDHERATLAPPGTAIHAERDGAAGVVHFYRDPPGGGSPAPGSPAPESRKAPRERIVFRGGEPANEPDTTPTPDPRRDP